MPILAATSQSDVLRACRAIRDAIGSLETAPGFPSVQVFVGNPTSTKLTEAVINQGNPVQVAIWPHPGMNTTRFPVVAHPLSLPRPTLEATVDGNTITFSGQPQACNVHTVVNDDGDAYFVPANGDTLAQVATAVANLINGLDLPGVTATPAGESLTVTGARSLACNIGVSGLEIREIARTMRQIQVSIFAPTGHDASDSTGALALCDVVGAAILSQIGPANNPHVVDELGLAVRILNAAGDRWDDDAQLSYSIYKWILLFDVEHAITQIIPVTPVGVVEITTQINNTSPTTRFYGGAS